MKVKLVAQKLAYDLGLSDTHPTTIAVMEQNRVRRAEEADTDVIREQRALLAQSKEAAIKAEDVDSWAVLDDAENVLATAEAGLARHQRKVSVAAPLLGAARAIEAAARASRRIVDQHQRMLRPLVRRGGVMGRSTAKDFEYADAGIAAITQSVAGMGRAAIGGSAKGETSLSPEKKAKYEAERARVLGLAARTG